MMIWILLVVMQLKHYIADYPLQNPYMLGKFKDKDWVKPLASHCMVHFTFTYWISTICLWRINGGFMWSILLAGIDFSIHFVMDRIKASPNLLGRYEALSKEQFKGLVESRQLAVQGINYTASPELMNESKRLVYAIDQKFRSNKYFWYALGFDQMIHHLTDILVIFFIFKIITGAQV